MEPAAVSLCSLIAGDERKRLQLLISRIQKIQAKHTDTRPLANAFCFTGSSASPSPFHVFPENGKADSSWGQGYTQWENKERKNVIITIGKGGPSFRALGDKRACCRERRLHANTTKNTVLYKSSHFPRGQHSRSARSLLSDTLLLHVSELPTPRKQSTSIKYQRLKNTHTNTNLFFLNQC